MPQIPLIKRAKSKAFCKSLGPCTRLQVAVATASAKDAFFDKIATLSAEPKLNECPTVPEEVHMPRGVALGFIFNRRPRQYFDFPE